MLILTEVKMRGVEILNVSDGVLFGHNEPMHLPSRVNIVDGDYYIILKKKSQRQLLRIHSIEPES